MNLSYLRKTASALVATLWMAGAPFSSGMVSASELQTHYLSVQLENATLRELFDIIEEKFNYSFLIRNNDIDLSERVSLDISNKSVEEILTNALKKQNAEFTVNDNRIIVYKSARQAKPETTSTEITQQVSTLKGVVVDAVTNEPIIGANVIVKGTTTGTSTDLNGNFSFDAPAGSTLVVSYIGYNSIEVRATAIDMTIQLREDTQNLSEVVVVGYGVQKRESLTGSMQVVSSEKLLDNTTATVENMLSGKAPGVYVSPGEGQPGQAGKIVIRGKSTVNGSTDPLWVIDGVIVGSSSGSLNPADIESMSILKDAASTAIYGSQGANGVILVTTKKGRTGKATVNTTVKLGVSQFSRGNLEFMDGAELYDYFKSFPNQEIINFPRWNEDLRNANYDWFKKGTQSGFTQDYNVSVKGGSEKMKTYLSLGYYNEDGAVKEFNYERYSFRFNVDYDVFDWLKIKPQISGARSDVMDQQASVSSLYANLPWDSPYDEEGNLVGNKPNPTWVNTSGDNYLYDQQWNFKKTIGYEFMGNFDFDIKLTDWLTFSSVNNYRYVNSSRKEYLDPRSSDGKGVTGSLRDRITQSYRIYSNQILRFNKTFDAHSVNALAAYEWNTYTGTVNESVKSGFASGFTVADAAAVPRSIVGSQNEWAVQSMLFNVNYAYDNRYLAQFSFRRDGASNFGTNAKYGNFFSISGGWNIHREEFFTVEYVDQLKLRASYGSVGKRPDSFYPHLALYSTDKYNEQPGGVLYQIENKDLTWEKTYTTGVGLDAMFFQRVNVSLDFYHKNTSNLLYQVRLPSVTGVNQAWRNVGSVKNKGFEATVSVDILKDFKDWDWSVEANIGLNRNKVDKLYGEDPQKPMIIDTGSGVVDNGNKILQPGLDADSWYMTEWAGVDPATGKAQWYTTSENGERVKTFSYSEASQHKVVVGKYSPDFFGGFSTNARYKAFDLSTMFSYNVGGEIYNYNRIEYDSDGTYTDRNQMKLQNGWTRWEKPNDIATHPQPMYGNNTASNEGSSRHLESATYLKMKNLTIGYNIALPHWHISNLRIYVSGENLFTITDFSGADPELPATVYDRRTGASRISGVATSIYPQTRKFMFGLSVTL
jgi:TonB-linked SusC/RagA family outer membrane protein